MSNKKNYSAICIFPTLDNNNNSTILSLYCGDFSNTNCIITISDNFAHNNEKTTL